MLFEGMFCEKWFQADQYFANVAEFLKICEFDDKKNIYQKKKKALK